jgi:sorbitol-6-phosphate 2-dehydrogenase
MPGISGRVAIVTGAAQGLGEAIANRLALDGCSSLTLADMSEEKLKTTSDKLAETHKIQVLPLRIDVADPDQVKQMVRETEDRFGRLDILIANAGILRAHDILEFPVSEWKAVIEVNLVGYFLCAQAAAKAMAKNRSGVIVQINSKSGKKGSFRNSAYAASKFGGIGLTQSIALDLAPLGIRVNAVCPGNLLDGTLWQQSLYDQYARNQGLSADEVRKKYEAQVPLGRGCTYEDVCNVVSFLVSDQSSYMTGQAINVTGGQEMR